MNCLPRPTRPPSALTPQPSANQSAHPQYNIAMNTLRLSLIALVWAALACSPVTPAATPTPVEQGETPVPAAATATSGPPTDTPLPIPPTAGPATDLRLVIAAPDHTAYLADLNGNTYPTTDAQEALYVFTTAFNTNLGEAGHAYNVSSAGVFQLDVAQDVFQGFAAYVGPAAPNGLLAWDSYSLDENSPGVLGQIHVSSPDGGDQRVAYEETNQQSALRVWRWAADGQHLFFSKEPLGLGGYIPFDGITNIWLLDLSDGSVQKLASVLSGLICIDDLSANWIIMAHHCTAGLASVEALGQGPLAAVAPPPEAAAAGLIGDVRLSPDEIYVAFALALGSPEAEQGWVAVSDGGGQTAHLVATSDPGEYFHVVQWLDAHTLLLQSVGAVPGVYRAAADGSGAVRLGDGWLLGVIDNLPGQP